MPLYLTDADYPAIRRMLGLAGDDTSSLPNEVIEDRPHLARVEREVTPILDACDIEMDSDEPAYDEETAEWVREALQYLTAGRLAALMKQAATGGEITSESVGPVRVSYRTGADWHALAESLLKQGVQALAKVCSAAGDLGARGFPGDVIVLAGPTRRVRTSTAGRRSLASMLDELRPNLLGGRP